MNFDLKSGLHKESYLKFLLLFLMILGFGLYTKAHNAVKLIYSDARETILMLSDHPRVSLDGATLLISSDKDDLQVLIEDTDRFEFIDYEEASAGKLGVYPPTIILNGEVLEVLYLQPHSQVIITDLTGKTIASSTADNSGYLFLQTGGWPKGVYILITKEKTFKFYKK